MKHLLCLALALGATAAFAHGNVSCPAMPKEEKKPQMELQRKLKRGGSDARSRIRREQRLATATHVVDNSGTLDDLVWWLGSTKSAAREALSTLGAVTVTATLTAGAASKRAAFLLAGK